MSGFVGIPFLDGGRTREGCDCWGLVRLVYAAEGVELPAYGEIGATEMTRIAREFRREMLTEQTWLRADHLPRAKFDAVVMRRAGDVDGIAWHIGVLIDQRRLLHTERTTDSVIVPLSHHSIAARLVGFYRHRNFA